jgi:hypothetical protein
MNGGFGPTTRLVTSPARYGRQRRSRTATSLHVGRDGLDCTDQKPKLVYPFPTGVPKTLVQGVHGTGNLVGYPAIDFGAPAFTTLLAIATRYVDCDTGTGPGHSHGGNLTDVDCGKGTYGYNLYLHSDAGHVYFMTHLKTRIPLFRERVTVGQRIGSIVDWEAQHCSRVIPNHVHIGAQDADAKGPNILAVWNAPEVAPAP